MNPSALAGAMSGVTYAFVRILNCLHESGAVSRVQTMQSLEEDIRRIYGQPDFAPSEMVLAGIVQGLRLLEQNQEFPPQPAASVLHAVTDTPPTDG